MALDAAEKLSVLEILDISAASEGKIHNGFGILLTFEVLNTLRDYLTNAIETGGSVTNPGTGILDLMSGAKETKVAALVADWDALGNDDIEIVNGSVGPLSGINYSSQRERDAIYKKLLDYVPVMRAVDAIRKKDGKSRVAGCQIPVING